MKIINLFGGPGSSKSTTAAGLFFLMKNKRFNVELINEFAKQLVWQERTEELPDQFYISAKQNHKLFTLNNKVDYVISDSPLLLGILYTPPDYHKGFTDFLLNCFNSYDNINFFIKRSKPYNPKGRVQTELEAIEKDKEIKDYLDKMSIKYIEINGDIKAPENILNYLTQDAKNSD